MIGTRAKRLDRKFWPKVDKRGPDDCWLWTGTKSQKGYGVIAMYGGTPMRYTLAAHRVAWMFSRGPIPKGMLVCHRCDNPPCCNPSHLFLGTNDDNMADMKAKGRSTHGEKSAGHKLTELEVLDILGRIRSGAKDSDLAREYGIGVSTVQGIRTGRVWRRVTGGACLPRTTVKLDAERVKQIRRVASEERITHHKLAERFGVAQTTISRLLRGEAWRNV